MLEWIIFFTILTFLYKWMTAVPEGFPDGVPRVPILGSIPFLESKNFHFALEKLREKYGPIIGMKIGLNLSIAVCGSDEIKEALKHDDFSSRPEFVDALRPGSGVMFANGEHWKQQRRFVLRHLRDFGFGKNLVSDFIAEEVEEFCEKKLKGKNVVQGSGLFNICAINILWTMIGGKRFSYEDKHFNELLNLLQQFFRQGSISGGINFFVGLKKFISLFYEFEDNRIENKLCALFQKAIEEHKATKTDEPRDLIDVYLSQLENKTNDESFSVVTLIETCRELFSAGTESSSNTVSYALMYLLLHPEWQEKMYVEIQKQLNGRTPRMEDKAQLPIVEAFLAESQRCNTIAPLSIPRTATKDTIFRGYRIPKGTFINISLWAILQDKQIWGDPQNFRPERHLDADGKFMKNPNLLFFGMGSRVCLGENLARSFVFLFFVSLLQRYKFKLPKDEPPPSTICMPGFTTAPQPFNFEFEARH